MHNSFSWLKVLNSPSYYSYTACFTELKENYKQVFLLKAVYI